MSHECNKHSGSLLHAVIEAFSMTFHSLLVFLVAPRILYISSSSKQLVVEEGESLTLKCQAVGKPAPRVIWQRKGKILSEGIEYVRYTFFRIQLQDQGTSVCLANNTAGEITYAVTITVKGKSHLYQILS